MTPIYRLMFDVSVYYTVSGIYLQAFFGKLPSMPGMLLIFAAMLLFGVLCQKEDLQKWRSISFVLPALVLLFRPGILLLIHCLPAWLFVAVTLSKGLGDTEYQLFHKKIFKSLGLIGLSLIPVFLMVKPAFAYLGNVLIYVVFMLVSAVICLRSLRDRTGGLRHFAVIGLFAGVCGLLDHFRIPQMLLTLLRDGILRILAYFEDLTSSLPAFNPRQPETKKQTVPSGLLDKEKLGWDFGDTEYQDNVVLFKWIELILAVAITVVVVFFLVKLLIGLIKSLKQMEAKPIQRQWDDEVVRLRLSDEDHRSGKKRRKLMNHRLTVRYYYWKYMQECTKRGIPIRKGWTAEDLADASMAQFSNGEVAAMQQLYTSVRYDEQTDVTAAQARESARIWHNLKKNKV